MKIIKISILFQIFAGVLSVEMNAQSIWTWLSPKPQGNVLVAVHALDTNIIVAVGDASTIIRTVDGGKRWDVHHRVGGTADYLSDVAFNNLGKGIAVGQNGIVLLTTDAGETWSKQSAGIISFLSSVVFKGDQIWLVTSYDGKLYRSTNGGLTWNNTAPAGSYSFNDLHFVTSNTGFAVGASGSILRTTDGGVTWQDKSVTTTYALRGACFFTPDTGFVFGDMGISFKTFDGGQTWLSRSNVPILWKMTFVSRYVGYGTGGIASNSIYKTTDGGESWILIGLGDVGALSFANSNVGFGVGGSGTILKTQDAGNNWQAQSTLIESMFFRDIAFVDKTTGVIVGWNGKIYRTTDCGEFWDSRWGDDVVSFNSIVLKDSIGFIVGSGGQILKSINQGKDWISQNSGMGIDLNGVDHCNSITIAVGESGNILRSTDFGLTWTNIPSGTNWGLHSVGFFSDDTVIIVGGEPYIDKGGIILRSTDKGVHWTNVLGITPFKLNQVAIHGRTAIATSLRGQVYISTNYGTSWISHWLGIQDDLYGIALSTEKKGLVATGFGGVFSTSDGGATWNDAASPTANWLFGICFINPDTAMIVGSGSTILQLSSSSTADIIYTEDNLLPKEFFLDQNYPNPFNPTTAIQYQLSLQVNVQLSVFDILGRQVRVLVKENQSRGLYSVIFDGSDLPSGTYFYQLMAGSFSKTKKLILLK